MIYMLYFFLPVAIIFTVIFIIRSLSYDSHLHARKLTAIYLEWRQPVMSDVTLNIGDKRTAVVKGVDQFGDPFPIDFTANPATFTDSNEAIASDVPAPTTGMDEFTALTPGTDPVTVSCAGFTASATLTVVKPPSVLSGISIEWQ